MPEISALLTALVVVVIVGAVIYLLAIKFITDVSIRGVVLLIVGLLLILYFLNAAGFVHL